MQITAQNENGLLKEYIVTIPGDMIEKEVENHLKRIQPTVQMDGFRKGKVPMKIVAQRYYNNALYDELERATQKAIANIIRDHSLRPALEPKLDLPEYKAGQDFQFTMKVETLPEVTIPDFAAITVKRYAVEADEKDLQEGLERLAGSRTHFHEAKSTYKAKKKDQVTMDFKGMIDGVAFEGGTAENVPLVLGSGQFIPGFEDQLIGVKAGEEKTVTVTFPENYHSKDLAGKQAEFAVKIHKVSQPHAPEVNEEFAKEIGFDSLEALKDAVKQTIVRDAQAAAYNHMKKELFDTLDPLCTFDIPQGMVDTQFQELWAEVEREMAADPEYTKKKSKEELRKEYEDITKRRVRLGILLMEVGRHHNIQVEQSEIRQAIYDQARKYTGYENKVVEFYRSNPKAVDQLKGPILEDKVVDFISKQVKVEEKPITLKAFTELMEKENDA